MDDFTLLKRTMDALAIILSAPLWPRRANLNPAGQDLFDRILTDSKPYSLLVADENYPETLAMAAGWSQLVHGFLETAHVNSPDTLTRMTNRRLVAVYRHYVAAMEIDLGAIQ